MNSNSIFFQLPSKLGFIEFPENVLFHFEKYKQNKLFSCEAGGQLFAKTGDNLLTKVVNVTGPRKSDKRSIFNYVPDRAAERVEISDHYKLGLHFVGDWHTHRQKTPTPSSTDLKSMRDLVRRSSHDLAGFIMVIVGQAKIPLGIHVSFHTKTGSTVLTPLTNCEKEKIIRRKK